MSRSKRSRAKERRRVELRPQAELSEIEPSRLALARRRAQLAKLAFAVAAVVCVAASMALARATYAGHAKHPVRSLSIPQPLYRVVRQNLLQAGILAPATAPPDAVTSTS